MTVSVQPSRDAASNSSARRRSGRGPWRRWQSGASAESVSASMPEYTQTRVRMRRPQARRTRALVCSGVTRSEKAFVSQCAPEAPIGVTFRQKVLRYQRTAQSVLNRGGALPTLSCAATYDSTHDTVGDRCTAGFQSLPFALKTDMGDRLDISRSSRSPILRCGCLHCT